LLSRWEAFAQATEDAQAAGEPVADIAAAMADGKNIKAEIIGDEATDRVLVITAEPERAGLQRTPKAAYQPRSLREKEKARRVPQLQVAPISGRE
jgi:hypothetical protein